MTVRVPPDVRLLTSEDGDIGYRAGMGAASHHEASGVFVALAEQEWGMQVIFAPPTLTYWRDSEGAEREEGEDMLPCAQPTPGAVALWRFEEVEEAFGDHVAGVRGAAPVVRAPSAPRSET